VLGAPVRLHPPTGGIAADFQQTRSASRRGIVVFPSQTIQALAKCDRYCPCNALARSGSELPRQALGFTVFDVQAHVQKSTVMLLSFLRTTFPLSSYVTMLRTIYRCLRKTWRLLTPSTSGRGRG
jgi:hypothetical protein